MIDRKIGSDTDRYRMLRTVEIRAEVVYECCKYKNTGCLNMMDKNITDLWRRGSNARTGSWDLDGLVPAIYGQLSTARAIIHGAAVSSMLWLLVFVLLR
ncbi:hypothetical protein [Novosphingobium lentum]|uniref:hypothetical protein n=1 Tax=Novosphingobium lentum TaxID=145287 RepID=UPI00082BDFE3|nr:hypothetical protein [Novosphingobium lentum]